jgi:hypothetical protein
MTKLAEDVTTSPGRTDDLPNHVHVKNDLGHVDKNEVHISKSAQDQVFWTHHGTKDAQIVFDTPEGSPFQARDPFVLQPGARVASGRLDTDKARVGKAFKYTVIGADDRNDPVVIIDK